MEVNAPFALILTTLAGLTTAIGSIAAIFWQRPGERYLALMLGFSAGVMVYVSFAELLKTSVERVGFGAANLVFFGGILFIAALDLLIPHFYQAEQAPAMERRPGRDRLMRAGMLAALGIGIHNLPEGLVTFGAAATGDMSLGITVAVAVALHNIPEGIAVSAPVLYATGSRRKALGYSLLSGLAEPVGALLGFAILLPFLSAGLMFGLLAFVAGVMVYISLDELLPLAHRYGQEHLVITGVVGGMGMMALSLFLLR